MCLANGKCEIYLRLKDSFPRRVHRMARGGNPFVGMDLGFVHFSNSTCRCDLSIFIQEKKIDWFSSWHEYRHGSRGRIVPWNGCASDL